VSSLFRATTSDELLLLVDLESMSLSVTAFETRPPLAADMKRTVDLHVVVPSARPAFLLVRKEMDRNAYPTMGNMITKLESNEIVVLTFVYEEAILDFV